jgi:long-chain fatty acid transport protein
MRINKIAASLISLGMVTSPFAFATNGMNLEGYGPIAEAMGGASMAYDNGVAAVMNNPATLGLMEDGSSRIGGGLGVLAPNITSKMPGASVKSDATAFYMPAIGYAHKSGQWSYGAAVFSQGGMGTEYAANSFMAAGSGMPVRSEVGVGRFMIPLVYQTGDLTVGGSLDFVWASMDLQMALSGAQFLDMAASGTQTYGSASGSMMTAFMGSVGAGVINPLNPVNWGYFDFSDKGKFSGMAKGNGFAEKIGFTYKVNPKLTVGGTYHTKTAMGDLNAAGATVKFNANISNSYLGGGAPNGSLGYSALTIPVNGSISVKNFQWPDTYAFGVAYQATDVLMVVADYKHIGWKAVMKDFNMTFVANSAQSNPLAGGFAGTTLNATLKQNWDDQNVFEFGAAYKTSEVLTLRAGVNIANNPIPDKYMNPLFPAIAKNHLTLGMGYAINKQSAVDFSYVYVPTVSATNGSGVTVDFAGYSAQLVYAYVY